MKKILIYFSALALASLLFVPTASAKVLSSKDGDIHVNANEVINDDLFIGAQKVVIDGTVNGNLFIGAKSVRINGPINGSVHVVAQNVNLSGAVSGSVYIGAQDVSVQGSHILGSLLIGSADAMIDKQTVVGGSIITADQSIDIDSQVTRNVYALAKVLTLGDNATIGRDFNYATSSTEGDVTISPKAKITGATYKTEMKTEREPKKVERRNGLPIGFTLFSFASALVVGLLYIKYFGNNAHNVENIIKTSFGKTLIAGTILLVVFLPVFIILCVTIIGLPLAFVSLGVLLLWGYLAKFVVGLTVGEFLAHRFNWKLNQYWMLASGLLCFYILKIIPFVGGIVGLVTLIVGVGAFTLHTFSTSKTRLK